MVLLRLPLQEACSIWAAAVMVLGRGSLRAGVPRAGDAGMSGLEGRRVSLTEAGDQMGMDAGGGRLLVAGQQLMEA